MGLGQVIFGVDTGPILQLLGWPAQDPTVAGHPRLCREVCREQVVCLHRQRFN